MKEKIYEIINRTLLSMTLATTSNLRIDIINVTLILNSISCSLIISRLFLSKSRQSIFISSISAK